MCHICTTDVRNETLQCQQAVNYGIRTLIKKKTKFSLNIRKFRWDRVQSHIQYKEGLPEMRKFFTIYEKAVSHIGLCTRSL
jgi:hypothetical protein